MSKIKLSGIEPESIVDGPGFRYVIFTQGCKHNCKGCHNPQTHDPNGGYWADTDDIIVEITKNPLLKGVTLSGGEPFDQAEALLDFAEKVIALGYDIFAYSGYTFEQLLEGGKTRKAWLELLKRCSVLVDGRFEIEKRSLELLFRGSSNQRLIDVKRSLATGAVVEANL